MSKVLQLDRSDFETQVIENTIASQCGKGISKCLVRTVKIKDLDISVWYRVLSHDELMLETNDLDLAIKSFNRQGYKS